MDFGVEANSGSEGSEGHEGNERRREGFDLQLLVERRQARACAADCTLRLTRQTTALTLRVILYLRLTPAD